MVRFFRLWPVLVWTASAWAGSLPTYRIETVAGSSLLGDGGPATLAQIGNIEGVAADRLGNIYLSDADHHSIRKINPSGVITTIAGTGVAGFSGDGGPATLAQLNFPYGLALDAAGYLYIADFGNDRVRRVAPDGTIATYAGGGTGALGDNGPAAAAEMFSPRDLTIDSAGNLYISEFKGHRVRKVSPNGIINTAAGTGVAGFNKDLILGTGSQLWSPAGLALDRSGILYIADSGNNRIRRLLPGGIIDTVLGAPTAAGSTPATTLFTPLAVAIDAASNILVVDGTALIHKYPTAGGTVSLLANGALSAVLTEPHEITVDFAGNIYIADGVHLWRLNGLLQIQAIAGDAYLHNVGDGPAATNGILHQPSGVALDSLGNLYIADSGTQRVRMVQPSGAITTFAGTGVAGYDRDQVPPAQAELNVPSGVAVSGPGSIFIADTYNLRIRRVGGGIISTFAGGPSGLLAEGLAPQQTALLAPGGVCLDMGGAVYIVDTGGNRVLRAGTSGTVQTAAGNGAGGAEGDGGLARFAQLNHPTACAVDSLGNLFIADTGNHSIRKVTGAGFISTVAGTGVAGNPLDDVPATTTMLSMPGGVAVDGNGNLYIADSGHNRIRLVTPDGVIHTIAGQGLPGFAGDGGDALPAQLSMPLGLTVDGAGNIYFADSQNNRVRRLVLQAALAPPPAVTLAPLALVNTASLAQGAVAPGELVTIYGSGIGPQVGAVGTFDATGMLGTLLGNTEVRFDGVPAPLSYAQDGQINAQVPYAVTGANSTHIEVYYQSRLAGTLDLTAAPTAPALFPWVVNQDGSTNAQAAPAPRGTIVTFYATGEGLTTGSNIAGLAAAPPYAAPAAPVTLSIGGIKAQLLYAGSAPGFVGLLQIDALVPGGFVSPGAAQVILTVGAATSPVLTMWLQ